MEKFGEIMKSCLNCKYSTEHYTGCDECVNENTHINWKPVETFQPLPMEEIKVDKKCQECEYYEDTYIIDTCCTCGISLSKFKPLIKPLAEFLEEAPCQKVDEDDLDSPEHPTNQELLPELDAFKLTNNNLAIFKQIQNKSHLCHYTKFQLDYDINTSIRFIHAFDDRQELVGKFIYKHHEEKLFSVIEPQLAEHFIKTQCSSEAEEFINRYVGQGKGKKYRRIKVTENSLTKYFES